MDGAAGGSIKTEKDWKITLKSEIMNLLVQNLAGIKAYLCKNRITAYRLVNNTHRLLPLTVDIYQDNAVIHVFSKTAPEVFRALEQALNETTGVDAFFYKNNTREEIDIPVIPPKKIVQEEYGNKFLINLSDYLDTGLFLDHRETRRWIAEQSRDKTVLNTFAYSGSFSVYAAGAGALKTYSIDLSGVYCDWTRENLALNNLPPENNRVYKMDSMEFFQYARKKNLEFDIIIIDPPTFSKNKGKSFSVQKDHPRLISAALEVLSTSGFILFSNNYRGFRINLKDLPLCAVSEKPDTIPPDFRGTQPHRCFVIKKRQRLMSARAERLP